MFKIEAYPIIPIKKFDPTYIIHFFASLIKGAYLAK